MKKTFITLTLIIAMLIFADCSKAADKSVSREVVPGIPVKNIVTLVDLGARGCISCKMMAPILEELKEEYNGRAAVIFIDVWDGANKGKAKVFKIRGIPTQIFFDKKGREVYRHVGFLDKDSIVVQLNKLLAQ